MFYLKVLWHHDAPDYPVEMWSELDADRYETRKMERYAKGTWECWNAERPDELGIVPVPELTEIQEQDEFTAVEIDRASFEHEWQRVCLVRP